MRLGKVLKSYRYFNGLSVRALAKNIGISYSSLNRIENGSECDSYILAKILVWLLKKSSRK